MSDDALHRAKEILVEEINRRRSMDIVEYGEPGFEFRAMLRFSDERLEMAAKHIQGMYPSWRNDPGVSNEARDGVRYGLELARDFVRSFKSTPPAPPETREQRLERALREIADPSYGPSRPYCIAREALREYPSTLEGK